MIIIDQSFETLGYCPNNLIGNLRLIEKAGRTCYQSFEKQGPDTHIKFAKNMAESGHTAMVEHSNLVVKYIDPILFSGAKFLTVSSHKGIPCVGGNYTAWMQFIRCSDIMNLEREVVDFCGGEIVRDLADIPKNLRRYSVKFVTSRVVTHELVRHRPASFGQLSQRYVDHTDNIKFIRPVHITSDSDVQWKLWTESCLAAEKSYAEMREAGASKQEARHVLPGCVHTEIVVTADIPEWQHIFKLRTSQAADPNMRALMIPLRDKMLADGVI